MNLTKKIQIMLGFLLLFSISMTYYSKVSPELDNIKTTNRVNNTDLKSSQWVLTSPIVVNDSIPTQNWAYTALNNPWCSGSGIWNDPYLIDDVTIDMQGVTGICLTIIDSTVYFRITNCKFVGAGESGIELRNTNNGILNGNNCSLNTYDGMRLAYSENNTISGNILNTNTVGLELYSSDYNTITGNALNLNSFSGIHIGYSDNLTITGNIMSYNDIGIYLGISENCTLSGNVMNSCGIFVSVGESEIDDFLTNTIDLTNTVNGHSVYYYSSTNNLKNSDFTNPGQLILVDCSDCFLSDFTITDASYPFQLVGCDNITIYNSVFTSNIVGITVKESSFINVTANYANNNEAGMSLYKCDNCTVSENNANNNLDPINFWGYGINLGSCENCTVSGNTASNNFESGLEMYACDDINILDNTLNFNRYGIYTYDIDDCKIDGNIIGGDPDFFDNWDVGIYLQYESANNTLKDNLMTYCGLEFSDDEDLEYLSSHDIDSTNLVNGNPLYYYVNQDGLLSTAFSNGGQVFLINTNNSIIDNLELSNTTTGIYLYFSNDNTISNCQLKHNKGTSLKIIRSHNNVLTGNSFGDSNEGHLVLHESNYNNITDTIITDNPVNNPHYGIMMGNCNYSYILRNEINNCIVGITLFGTYNTISHNNISYNIDAGIYLAGQETGEGYNTLYNNTITYNWNGVTLDNSDNNEIINNSMSYNREIGLVLIDSDFNTISGNLFYCNRDGCYIEDNCLLNDFENNTCEECPSDNGTNGPWISGYDLLILIGVMGITVFLLRKRKLNL